MTADTLNVWQGFRSAGRTAFNVSGVTTEDPPMVDPELEWLLRESSPGRNTWAILAIVLWIIPAVVALGVVIAST